MIILLIIAFIIALIALKLIIMGIVLRDEINAAFERDPAASNYFEVVFTYAGIHALMFYKISHGLYMLKVPFLPRLISQIGRWF